MNKLIQIKIPIHEKLVIDRVAKSEGFRSTASFAYYAIKQQLKKIREEAGSSEVKSEKLKVVSSK